MSGKEAEEVLKKRLLEKNLVTQDEVIMVEQYSKLESLSFSQSISKLGLVSEESLLQLMVEVFRQTQNNKNTASIFKYKSFSSEMENSVRDFPYNLALEVSRSRNQCVFYWDASKNVVKIATPEIYDIVAVSRTKSFYESLGISVQFYVCTGMDLALLQNRIYRKEASEQDRIFNYLVSGTESLEVSDIISLIVEIASIENASDIYFVYKNRGASYLYFRVDRQKRFVSLVGEDLSKKIKMYVMQISGMEAGKLKGHQDGSMQINILNDKYTITARVSWITTISGGQFTIRLQDEKKPLLRNLGFDADDVEKIEKVLSNKKGIIILSGVTGSGKTTTLYSMLNYFNPNKYNIITMEDPVEIVRDGVNQVEINEAGGQSFAQTIRASLRQAPDIILLGEIRDRETAQRAVEAALTGHLVLTTVHCPSVIPGLRDRLKELGVENIDGLIRLVSLAIYQELLPKKEGGLRLGYEISFDMKTSKKVGLDNE